MKNKKKKNDCQTLDALYGYMEMFDDDDLPDGAWWWVLEDAARFHIKENNLPLDPFDAVSGYIIGRRYLT